MTLAELSPLFLFVITPLFCFSLLWRIRDLEKRVDELERKDSK